MSLINDALKRAGNKQTTPPGENPPPADPGGGSGFKLSGDYNKAGGSGGSGTFAIALVLIVVAAAGWFGWRWWSARQKPTQTASSGAPAKSSVSASNAAAGLVASGKLSPTQSIGSNTPVTAPAQVAAAPAKTQTVPPPPPGGLNPIERARAVLGTIKAARADSDANAAAMQATPATIPASAPVAQTPVAKVEVAKVDPPKAEAPAIQAPKPTPATAPPAKVEAQAAPAVAVTEKPAAPPVEWPQLKLQAVFYRFQGATARVNGKTLRAGDEIDGAKVQVILRRSVIFRIGEETKEISLK